MSITESLARLDAASEGDEAFIIAGTINLYSEAIRRRKGRILYGPDDVKALLGMIDRLLNPPELIGQSYVPPGRTTAPNPVERDVMLDHTLMQPKAQTPGPTDGEHG